MRWLLLGRRSDFVNESRPIEETLIEVIASSDEKGRSFSEIVSFAKEQHISRATVARYLSALVKRGIVKKNRVYRLAKEAVHWKHAQRSLFSVLSMSLFDDTLDSAGKPTLNDKEFTRVFTGRIGALAMYTLLQGLSMKEQRPEEAGRWIEEAFGTLVQKYGWRVCLNRQLFGEPKPLKRPIDLETLPVPEIIVEEETIYVKLPLAVERGLTARVLRELPPIPDERLNALRSSLKKLYPKEIKLLDNAYLEIKEAARTSRRR